MASINEPRLYVEEALKESGSLTLSKQQSHYLARVLRLGCGDLVYPFNERDGEWQARIESAGKTVALSLVKKLQDPEPAGRLILCFAPLKRLQTDLVVQKATEMGVAEFRPFFSEYSNTGRIRMDRMQAIIREACEQCGRIRPPEFHKPGTFEEIANEVSRKALPVFLDETAASGEGQRELLKLPDDQVIVIFAGPEGGFSKTEQQWFLSLENRIRLSLGRYRLRAETAALAGVALLQSLSGDWSQ